MSANQQRTFTDSEDERNYKAMQRRSMGGRGQSGAGAYPREVARDAGQSVRRTVSEPRREPPRGQFPARARVILESEAPVSVRQALTGLKDTIDSIGQSLGPLMNVWESWHERAIDNEEVIQFIANAWDTLGPGLEAADNALKAKWQALADNESIPVQDLKDWCNGQSRVKHCLLYTSDAADE